MVIPLPNRGVIQYELFRIQCNHAVTAVTTYDFAYLSHHLISLLRMLQERARMSGGGGGGLMSCVREGSLEPPYRPPVTDTHNHGEY